MIERKEIEGTGAGKSRSDPRLDDPPKPVVYAGEASALAAKIAKLNERLAVASQAAPAVAPPALLTSGSLNEARAYLPQIEPVASEESRSEAYYPKNLKNLSSLNSQQPPHTPPAMRTSATRPRSARSCTSVSSSATRTTGVPGAAGFTLMLPPTSSP